MIHAFLSLVFIFAVGNWLKSELNQKNVSLRKHWPWVASAVGLQLTGALLAEIYDGKFGNFLLHGLGGGAAATVLFFYLIKTFHFKTNWRLELAVVFMFVSTLGALNELAEYIGELVNLGIFSFDSHDTWRDLVANTAGMFITWLGIRVYLLSRRADQTQKLV